MRSVRHRLPALLLGLSLGPFAALAIGQTAPAPSASAAPPPPARPAGPPRVGDATTDLLALQREGSVASTVPRPIAGEVAGRSYQRYLRTFEHPIPERYGSNTAGSGGGASSGGAAR